MKISPETFAPQPNQARRIITSAITCVIWLIGLFYLKWNVYEAHFLFMLDMQLFVFFSFLRVLLSKHHDKSFFTNITGRVYFGTIILVLSSSLIMVFTKISLYEKSTYTYLLNSSNNLIYGSIALNYLGFFLHDFIFSDDYKTANPYIIGAIDFTSVLVIGCTLAITLNFSPEKDGPVLSFYNALGLVIARFALELFIELQGRSFLEKKEEQKPNE